jgi:anti-sigma regulatory factor (Ser/Thr protein kinase)
MVELALPHPSGSNLVLACAFDLHSIAAVRHAILSRASGVGLGEPHLSDFILAVNEVTSNAVRHGGGKGRLRLWQTVVNLVCEVVDDGAVPASSTADLAASDPGASDPGPRGPAADARAPAEAVPLDGAVPPGLDAGLVVEGGSPDVDSDARVAARSERMSGHHRPPPAAEGGRGLWLARRLCDTVTITATAAGTRVVLAFSAHLRHP